MSQSEEWVSIRTRARHTRASRHAPSARGRRADRGLGARRTAPRCAPASDGTVRRGARCGRRVPPDGQRRVARPRRAARYASTGRRSVRRLGGKTMASALVTRTLAHPHPHWSGCEPYLLAPPARAGAAPTDASPPCRPCIFKVPASQDEFFSFLVRALSIEPELWGSKLRKFHSGCKFSQVCLIGTK